MATNDDRKGHTAPPVRPIPRVDPRAEPADDRTTPRPSTIATPSPPSSMTPRPSGSMPPRPSGSMTPRPSSTSIPPASRSMPPESRRPSSKMNIATIDFDIVNAARRIFEGALSLVPGDRVLLILDREREGLATALAETARTTGARCDVVFLEDFALRPITELPPPVRTLLEQAQASVLLVGIERGEQRMRMELIAQVVRLGLRHAHMVGVTRRSLIAGFSVDPARVLDATRAVRMRLRPDSVMRLQTAAGSDLTVKFTPRHRWAEHVGLIRPGRWENLPTGELLTAPASVDGVFVCDASIGGHFEHKGILDRTPVRVEIAQGSVTRATCQDRGLQRQIDEYLRSEPDAARVGTVVIGTNVGMLTPIGEMVCDQNLPGLHLSLGNTFPDITGAEPGALSQLTLTTSGANLDLDGAQLLRAGRYLV